METISKITLPKVLYYYQGGGDMTLEDEFETLKCDYIQKSQAHLKELQGLQINDFDKVTTTVDIVLTQHAASMSFLFLSIFIKDHRKRQQ